MGGDLCQAVGHSLDVFGHAITIDSQITYGRKLKHNGELLAPGETTNYIFLNPKLCLFSYGGRVELRIELSKRYLNSKKTLTIAAKRCFTVSGI